MKKETEYQAFLPSAIAIMERPPRRYYRLVSFMIMLFSLIAIMWLCLAKVDIIVTAQGKVVPSGKVKVIQSAEEGVVSKIYVRDGQIVKQGTPLIEMDATNSEADEQQLQIKRTRAVLTLRRLRAELGLGSDDIGADLQLDAGVLGVEQGLYRANQQSFAEQLQLLKAEQDQAASSLGAMQAEISKLRAKITFYRARLQQKRQQAKSGLIAAQEAQEVEFELNSARKELVVLKAREQESVAKTQAAADKLESMTSDHASALYKELSQAETELKSIEQDLIKAKQRTERQVLKAPVDGVIQQLAVNTVGGYIARADKLMVIVPENTALELDAHILNKDIGFVVANQTARIKVDAFEYTRYGMLPGELQWVGSDAIVDEKKGQIYPIRVALNENHLPNKVNNRIASVVPGMSATVDIVIGQRRLIQYFIAPMLRYRDESLRER